MIGLGYMEFLYRIKLSIINKTDKTIKSIHLESDSIDIPGSIKKLKPNYSNGLSIPTSLFQNHGITNITLYLTFKDNDDQSIRILIYDDIYVKDYINNKIYVSKDIAGNYSVEIVDIAND